MNFSVQSVNFDVLFISKLTICTFQVNKKEFLVLNSNGFLFVLLSLHYYSEMNCFYLCVCCIICSIYLFVALFVWWSMVKNYYQFHCIPFHFQRQLRFVLLLQHNEKQNCYYIVLLSLTYCLYNQLNWKCSIATSTTQVILLIGETKALLTHRKEGIHFFCSSFMEFF